MATQSDIAKLVILLRHAIESNLRKADAGKTVSDIVTLVQTAGAGDLVGPASSTDNAVPLFDGTTGKLLKNSTLVPTAAGISMINAADAVAQQALLQEAIQDMLVSYLVAGTNITLTPNDGANTLTVAASGGSGASKVSVVVNTGSLTVTNIPAAVQELSGTRRHRVKFDGTGFARVRLALSLSTAAPTGGTARAYIQYSLDDATYVTVGSGTGTETCSLVSNATTVSDYITMPAPAQADVWWRVVTQGGDGADDPILGLVALQFSTT